MKKLFSFLALLIAAPLFAQGQRADSSNPLGGDIRAASTNCSVAVSCVWQKLPANATTLTVTVTNGPSGAFVATLQFEQSADGGFTFSSASPASTATIGTFTFTVTSFTDFRVRASAFTSGDAAVNMQAAGSTTGGGGGGGGTVTSITGVSPIVVTPSPLTTTGTISCPTCTTSSGTVFPVTVSGAVTSGGIPYFNSTTQESSSALLNSNILVKGGGAGGAPTNSSITDNGTTVSTTEPITTTGSVTTGSGCTPASATATGGICMTEATSTGWTPTAGFDYMRADATLHNFAISINGSAETPHPTFSAVPTGSKCLQSSGVAGLLVETAGACGSGSINGLTTGFIPKAASATSLTNSLCDEAITTANTITCIDTNGLSIPSVQTGTSPPGCTVGTAGFWCANEGTLPTNVSGAVALAPSSTTHEFMAATNGASTATPGMMIRSQPSPTHVTAQTATKTIYTLCAASAGACNTAGQYRINWYFNQGGTACGTPGTGGVTFELTWVDNAGTHSAVAMPMNDSSSLTAFGTKFTFQTSNTSAWASGEFNIWSTGASPIQVTNTYTACSVGTGTWELAATVERAQ